MLNYAFNSIESAGAEQVAPCSAVPWHAWSPGWDLGAPGEGMHPPARIRSPWCSPPADPRSQDGEELCQQGLCLHHPATVHKLLREYLMSGYYWCSAAKLYSRDVTLDRHGKVLLREFCHQGVRLHHPPALHKLLREYLTRICWCSGLFSKDFNLDDIERAFSAKAVVNNLLWKCLLISVNFHSLGVSRVFWKHAEE